jgi:2-furoyl-CoA dehydrogenase FAD binding subunit
VILGLWPYDREPILLKPAAFDYMRAESTEAALAALAEHGPDAQLLAGGLSLMPMLNMRLARPQLVVDISRLPGTITSSHGRVHVDFGVTQAQLLSAGRGDPTLALLALALPWVGHEQTRARGTVCGSVAHADPAAEIPLCLAVLDGTAHLRSCAGARTVRLDTFLQGLLTTARTPDELLEAVSFASATSEQGFAFAEFGRRHGDFAIVACAARVSDAEVTFGVGGVADTPVIRRFTLGSEIELDDWLNALAWEVDAPSDVHADARLRRDLIRALGRKTILEASSQCQS